MWNVFKQNYKEVYKIPSYLNYKNNISRGPNSMSNTFNNSFINKIHNLNLNIPEGTDPMEFYKLVIKTGDKQFNFKTIGLSKMARTIDKLKSTNTTGMDLISSKMIKDQTYLLTPILTHIFNLCVKSNNYPTIMKILKVIPVLKPNKDIANPENYRDINLSNVIAKIFDKIFMNQIIIYLNKYNILPSLHLGGMTGFSTIDAIELLHKKLQLSRQEKTPSIYISIDQSSAFSMIKHDILFKKLKHI